MAKTLADLKASSPAYANMDNGEFARRVYETHYADKMTFEQFTQRASGRQGTGAMLERQPTQAQQVREQLQAAPRQATAALRGERQQPDINAQAARVQQVRRRINELEADRARLDAEQMQQGDTVASVRGAIGSTLGGVGLGLQQFYNDSIVLPGSRLVQSGLDAIGLDRAADYYGQTVVQPAQERSQELRSNARWHREASQSLRNQGPISATAGVLSDSTAVLGPGLALRGTSAGAAVAPTTLRGNLVAGGAIGAIQPYETEGQRWGNIGGGIAGGGLGYGLGQVLGRAPGWFARDGLDRVDRRAGGLIQQSASNADAVLNPQASSVPGVQRTLGEATLDPGVMALERQARRTPEGQNLFTPIDEANNAARVAALRGIAGDDAAMDAAEAAREAASRQARDAAFSEGRAFDSAAEAEARAAREAAAAAEAERARYTMFGLEPPTAAPLPAVPQAPKSQLVAGIGQLAEQSAGRPSVQNTLRSVQAAINDAPDTVDGLYNSRKYVTDLLEGKAGNDMAAARSATRELMAVRDQIDAELTRRAPSWGQYLGVYQQGSKPINRMEAGRGLLERSRNPGTLDSQGGDVLSPPRFIAQTRDQASLDAMAARATGFKKAKAADIFTSDDLATIRNIADDLNRVAKRQSNPAQPGSPTNEAGMMQRLVEGGSDLVPMPRGLGRFVDDALSGVKQRDRERINQRLAELLADPEKAAAVLRKLNARDRRALQAVLASQQGALAGAGVSSGQ